MRVQKALARHGLQVTVQKVGSREIASRTDLKAFDFAFPAGVPAAEKIRRELGISKSHTPFFTPMVIASWRPIADLLVQQGIAANLGSYYTLDMAKFLPLIQNEIRWKDIPGNSAFPANKSVLIGSTDVRTSKAAPTTISPSPSAWGNCWRASECCCAGRDQGQPTTVSKLVSRRASVDGRDLPRSPKEFSLLAELIRHRGAVLSRDLLLTRVWGHDYVGTVAPWTYTSAGCARRSRATHLIHAVSSWSEGSVIASRDEATFWRALRRGFKQGGIADGQTAASASTDWQQCDPHHLPSFPHYHELLLALHHH